MTQKIIITDTASLGSLAPLMTNLQQPVWTYLGTNSNLFYQLKSALGRAAQYRCLGTLFNETASNIRDDFLNYDAVLQIPDEFELQWNLTHLAEKSPLSSPLFCNACTVITFSKYISQEDRDLLFIVDEWFVAYFVSRIARQKPNTETILNCVKQDDLDKNHFRTIRNLRRQQITQAHELLGRQITSLQARIDWVNQLRKANGQESNHLPKKIDTLMVLWSSSKTFTTQISEGRETYFGDLPKSLHHSETVAYLVNPLDWIEPLEHIYEEVSQSNLFANCLFLEDCIDLQDLQKQAHQGIAHRLDRKTRWSIDGVDLSGILTQEFYEEKARTTQCRALQFYYLAKFLKENDIEVKRIVFPYENQPWEKALRLGFKKWMPETKVVGYFHAANSEFWLSSYPGQTNLDAMNIPDQIAVPGEYWKERLKNNGFNPNTVSVWPAFRYAFLHSAQTEPREEAIRTPSEPINILLALPIDRNVSSELLIKTISVFSKDERFHLRARFHPKAPFGPELMTEVLPLLKLSELPGNISESKQSLQEDMNQARVIIANGTSIELQAMQQGKPTLCLLSDHGLDMPMLPVTSYTYSARSTEELAMLLDQIAVNQSKATPEPWDETKLNYYFCKNTEANRKLAFNP